MYQVLIHICSTRVTVYKFFTHMKKAHGTEVYERHDIANTLSAGFEKNYSPQHYTEKFKRFKVLKEWKPHNFSS